MMKRTKDTVFSIYKRSISLLLALTLIFTFLPSSIFAEGSVGSDGSELVGGSNGSHPTIQSGKAYMVTMVHQNRKLYDPMYKRIIAPSQSVYNLAMNHTVYIYNKYEVQMDSAGVINGGGTRGDGRVRLFQNFPPITSGNILTVRQKFDDDVFLSNLLYKVFDYSDQTKRLEIMSQYHNGDIAFTVEPIVFFTMPGGVKYGMTASQMAAYNVHRLGDDWNSYVHGKSLIAVMPKGILDASTSCYLHKDVPQWDLHAWDRQAAASRIARDDYGNQPIYHNSEMLANLGIAMIFDDDPQNPAHMDITQPNIKAEMKQPTLNKDSDIATVNVNDAISYIDPESPYQELTPEPFWKTAIGSDRKTEIYSALNPKGRTNHPLADALDQSLPKVVQELVEPAKTTFVTGGKDTEDQIEAFTQNLYNRNASTRSATKLFMSWQNAETPIVDFGTNEYCIKHKIVIQSKLQYESGSNEYLAMFESKDDMENDQQYQMQGPNGETGTIPVPLTNPYTGQPLTWDDAVGMEEFVVKFVTNYDRLEQTELPAFDGDYFARKESDYTDNVVALRVPLEGRNLQATDLKADYDYNTQEIKISGKGYVESLENPMVTYQQLAFQVLDNNGNPITTGSDQADLSRYSTGAKNADRFVIDNMPTKEEVKTGDTFDLGIPTSDGDYLTGLRIPYQMDTENIQVIAVHYRVNPNKLYPQGERTYDDNIITKYIIIDPNQNWQAQSVDLYSDQENANGPTDFNISVQTVGKLEKVPLGREDQTFQTIERVEYCVGSNGQWTTLSETTTDPMHVDDQTVHSYQLPPVHVDIGQQVVRVRYTLNPNHDQPTHESTFLDNVREESIILSVDPEAHAQETDNATIACGIARDSSGHNVNGLAYIGKMLGGAHDTYDPWGERIVDYELYDSDHYCPGAPGVPPSGRTIQEGIEAIGPEFNYHLQYRYYILDSTDAKDPMNPDLVIKYDPARGAAPSENEKTHVSVGEKYYDHQVISNPCHHWTTTTTHTREDGSTYTTSEDHDCGGYDWFIYKLKDTAEYKYYIGYNGDFSDSTIGSGHNASRAFAMEAQGTDNDYKLTAGTTIGAKIGVEIKTDSHDYEIPFKAMCTYSYAKGKEKWDQEPYHIINMVEKEYADTSKTGDIQRRYFVLPVYKGKNQAPTQLNYPESIMRGGKLAEGLTVTMVAQVDGNYSILDRSPGKNIKDLPAEYNPIYNVLGACYSRKLTVIDNYHNNYVVESVDN